MPRLNGKFASRAKYADAIASKLYVEIEHGIAVSTTPEDRGVHADDHYVPITPEETPVTTPEQKIRKPRTVDPVTAATAKVRQAKKELDRAKAYHAKPRAVPSVEAAQAEYDRAVSVLQDTLNV